MSALYLQKGLLRPLREHDRTLLPCLAAGRPLFELILPAWWTGPEDDEPLLLLGVTYGPSDRFLAPCHLFAFNCFRASALLFKIILSDGLPFWRVLKPHLVGHPQGVTSGRPPLVEPPWGWSTGFIASPRTVGRMPRHLLAPALPSTWLWFWGFDTDPIVA